MSEQDINRFDNIECLCKSENYNLLHGIFEFGFQIPSRIQVLTIKDINNGYDIIAQSQSGTGKTGAFTIGALSRVDVNLQYPQILILATTRELATQIHFVVSEISKHMNISVNLAIGGTQVMTGMQRDPYKAIRTSHVIIGTPGRVFDYINRKAFNPKKLIMFVMDEADALLKKDFVEQTQQIFNSLDEKCQIVIFSATYTDEILQIAESITSAEKTKKILMKHEDLNVDLIKQYKIDVMQDNYKYSTLADLYTKLQIGQCIIFVNSINTANYLKKKMTNDGFGVDTIHGELDTSMRNSVLKDFRTGITRVLIATDVLSRGIDIEQIGIVINYDLPRDYAQYLHRIGRSGRFGKVGVAINFVSNNDYENLASIEEFYKIKIVDMPSHITVNEFLSGEGGHLKLNTM